MIPTSYRPVFSRMCYTEQATEGQHRQGRLTCSRTCTWGHESAVLVQIPCNWEVKA